MSKKPYTPCISCHQGIAHRLPKKQAAVDPGNGTANADMENHITQIRE